MSETAFAKLGAAVAKTLLPPEDLSFSEWAEQKFRLSAATSAAPGRFRPWKFQRGILDAMGDPAIEQVSVIKSTRTGYTVSVVASIGAFATNEPCPIILYMPTEDDCRGIAIDEINPAFEATPALRDIMRSGRYDGRNTLTQRAMLGGGSLKILATKSPRNMRRHTARVIMFDEVDGMEISDEGDPILLAKKRSTSYPDRKIIAGSTPTDEETSFILKQYNQSDQRIFEIPCMRCGSVFELLWEHIDWKPKQPETAVCVCPHCAQANEEKYKPEMVEEGEWRVTCPDVPDHAGFRLNALISMFANASWPKLIREYEQAVEIGSSAMQVFENTVLGRSWSQGVNYINESQMMARAENFGLHWDAEAGKWVEDIPERVAYITVGVDVQINRLEMTFLGHAPDQVFVLGHHIIYGDVRLDYIWDELYAVLSTRWKHPFGGQIGVDCAGVDSGDGNMTQKVYDFCEKHQGSRIVAIKGVSGDRKWIEVSKKRRRGRTAPLYSVGVDQVKTHLQVAMAQENQDKGAIRFSNSLNEEWFSQLASERRVVRYKNGRAVIGFDPVGNRRHEALDCVTYGAAVAQLVPMKFEERYEALKNGPKPTTLRDSLRKLHS